MSGAEAATAEIFAALGDPARLGIVAKLRAGGARSITELSAGAAITRQAMTKHLRVLERAGLVACARKGRESRFALRAEPVATARAWLDDVAVQWEDALGRLQAHVEDTPR